MKFKIKNLTFLTLLLTAIPFISFTPISAMEEDLGEEVSFDNGDLHIGSETIDDLDALPEDVREDIAEATGISVDDLSLENIKTTPGAIDKLDEAKLRVVKSDDGVYQSLKSVQTSVDDPTTTTIDSTLGGGKGGEGDGNLFKDSDGETHSTRSARDRVNREIKTREDITKHDELKDEKKILKSRKKELEKEIQAEKQRIGKGEAFSLDSDVDGSMGNLDSELKSVNERLGNIDDDISANDRELASSPEGREILRREGKTSTWTQRASDRVFNLNKTNELGDWIERKINSSAKLERIKAEDIELQGKLDTANDELQDLRMQDPPNEKAIAEKEEKIADLEKMRRQNATLGRKFTRGVKDFAKGTFSVIGKVVSGFAMLIAQALAFTVPSALYQMTVAKEDRMALLETISDVQPFGKLFLQIPPQLIDPQNPTGSAYLYCEVPDGNKQDGAYFNAQFLRTANFYVTGAPQPSFWGTSYIGGSQFNGQMVCLNNGFVFVGGGQSANAQQPITPMIPTIEKFASGFVAKTSANTFHHTADATDWIRMDASSLMAAGNKNSFDDPVIKSILMTPMPPSTVTDNLPGTAGGQLPPPLFYTTITKFRTPVTVDGFGSLQLQQMQGTGFLNIILDNKIDTSETALQAALKALAKADSENEASKISSSGKVTYGDAELANLRKAQEAVAEAIKQQQVNTPEYGFSPDANINAHNLYIYEIVAEHAHAGTMTPSLYALLKNQPATYIPLKEYVVCLAADGRTIVPLLTPQIIQGLQEEKVKGSSKEVASGYTLQMVPNKDVTFISSLTTGLTYQAGQDQGTQTVTNTKGQKMSSAKLLTPYVDSDGSPDFGYAINALQNIEGQLNQSGEIGVGALNQIVAMSNYTTDAAIDGPFTTYNGYTLTRVPLLELLGGDAVEQQDERIEAMGDVLANSSNKADQNAAYTSWSEQEKKAYLSNFYIYKVGKGKKGEIGALARDIPDYVVPVGGATSGKFEILPLGADQITGGLGTHGVQGLFSLITGQGYDADYDSLPLWYTVNMHPLNRGSYFPIRGAGKYGYQSGTWVGQEQSTIYVDVKNSQGQMIRAPKVIRTISDVYMGTAFMPQQYNPANRIITNENLAQQYDDARSNVIRYGLEFQRVTDGLLGLSAGTKEFAFKQIDQYGQSAVQKLLSNGFSQDQVTGLMGAKNAGAIESSLEQAQTVFNKLNTIVNTNRNSNGELFNPAVTAWKNNDLVLTVPPLYFLFFTGFSFCSDPGGGQSFPAFPPAGGNQASALGQKIKWAQTKPCQNATSLFIKHDTGNVHGSLMSVLPVAFSGFNLSKDLNESSLPSGPLKQTLYYQGVQAKGQGGKKGDYYHSILATYTEWALTQDRTNYWAQTGFLGPFNFTQRQYGNVYITATSRADVANGNFFYHASGFSPADIFVCAVGPADGNVTSLSQLRDIGKPYADLVVGNYLINVGTGQLYTPYIDPGAKSEEGMQSVAPFACFSGALLGNECSLQPVGQNVLPGGPNPANGQVPPPVRTGTQIRFNPKEVLAAALSNQRDIGQRVSPQSGLNAAFATLSYSLQREINTAMQAAEQQVQKSLYPIYFGDFTLRLTEQSIVDGTYIYAVVSTKEESYEDATDYLVVADMPGGSLQTLGAQAVNPYAKTMLSLVTGTVYNVNGQSKQNYMGKVYAASGVGREQDVPKRLMEFMEQVTKVKINEGLVQRIFDLNSAYIKQSQSLQESGSLLNNAPIIPIQALLQAKKVTEPGLDDANMPTSNLIEMGDKYFLKVKSVISGSGAGGKGQTLYTLFDFNATNENIDSNVGMRYTMPENQDAENLEPTAAVTGFELEAMRAAHGVAVEPNGAQAVTIPVKNMPLPLPPGKNTLIPNFGKDSEYMVLAKHIAPIVNREKGEKYYYYYHRVTQAYYVLIQDLVGVRYGGGAGDSEEDSVTEVGYFVDLMSGDEYYVNGQPRMTPTTVSYAIVENQNKQEVINVGLPLFTWGRANNVSGEETLNLLANTGEGYTQYQYVPFTTIYRFENKTQTMLIGYEIRGEGASQKIIPMREITTKGSKEVQNTEIDPPGNTQGMTQQQAAELAFISAIEQSSQNGWSLYEIEYKVSPSGMAYGAIPFTKAPGESPRRYKFGNTHYLEGGVKGFNYPLAENNALNQAIARGRSFVSIGMGNRQGTQGIPQGTAQYGTTLCGVMDATEEAMLGFVPTVNTNFYLIDQSSLPRPGQFADYQAGRITIPGLVTNYSVTGQQSASGVALQSSYIALQAGQGIQSIYGFDYSYASNKMLERVKSTVNVLSNAEGYIQLIQAIDRRSETNINIPRGSIGNYLSGFTSPVPTVLYQVPPLHVAEAYFASDNTQYNVGGGDTMSAIEMFNNMVSTFGVGTYIDYYSGAVFEIKKDDPNYFYPNGFSVSSQALSLIRKQFRGAVVEAGSLTLMSPGAVDAAIARATGGSKLPPRAPGATPAFQGVRQYFGTGGDSLPTSSKPSTATPPPGENRDKGSVQRNSPPPPNSAMRSTKYAQVVRGGYTMLQQPINVAFMDLGKKVLSVIHKVFGQRAIA